MSLDMEWGRLKNLIENRFCEPLQKRLTINLTHYRSKIHEPESRFWITLDKREIFSVSKLKWLKEWYELTKELKCSYDDAEKIMIENGKYSVDDISTALNQYLSLPFDKALISSNSFIRSFAMVDKRLGKRRLRNIVLTEDSYPLLKLLYLLRCEVEGIKPEII